MSDEDQRFTAWLARLEREHGEEIEAEFARLDGDTALFEACDHDWRADALGDPRHEWCAKCGWGRFQPTEEDMRRIEAQCASGEEDAQ